MQKPLQHIAAAVKKNGTKGATSRAAARAGESTEQWSEENKHSSDPTIRGRATSALAFIHASKGRK